jgi:hypothetical protein
MTDHACFLLQMKGVSAMDVMDKIKAAFDQLSEGQMLEIRLTDDDEKEPENE